LIAKFHSMASFSYPTVTTNNFGSTLVIKNDNGQRIDITQTFPPSKIKGLIRQEEGIGKLYHSAVELIAASSAIFIEQLKITAIQIAQKEATKEGNGPQGQQPLLITQNHLRRCVTCNLLDVDTSTNNTQPNFKFLKEILGEDIKIIPSYSQLYAKKKKKNDYWN